jgi:hypothetical protein
MRIVRKAQRRMADVDGFVGGLGISDAIVVFVERR